MHRSGLSAKPASVDYTVSLCEVYRMREAGDGGRRGTEAGEERREGKEVVRRHSAVPSEPRSGVRRKEVNSRRTSRPDERLASPHGQGDGEHLSPVPLAPPTYVIFVNPP